MENYGTLAELQVWSVLLVLVMTAKKFVPHFPCSHIFIAEHIILII
jgi:hypothetical protein